jgi:hypothetical protein
VDTQQEDSYVAKKYPVDSNGRAVFYSGGANYFRAYEYANQKRAVTVERTSAGRALFTLKPLNRNTNNVYTRNPLTANRHADRISTITSWRFAKTASGDVKTFVCGARHNSVFRKTELPTLLRNKKVTSINGIDRNTLAKMHKDNPNRAFRAVCLAELRQDRKEAMRTKDKELRASRLGSVRERQGAYKGTLEKNPKSPVLASVRNQQNLNVPSNRQNTPESKRSNTANATQNKSPTKTQPPPPPPQQSQKRGR